MRAAAGNDLPGGGVGAALREVPLALWRRYLAYQLVHAHPPYFASALSGGALRETDSLSQASCTIGAEMGREKVADLEVSRHGSFVFRNGSAPRGPGCDVTMTTESTLLETGRPMSMPEPV